LEVSAASDWGMVRADVAGESDVGELNELRKADSTALPRRSLPGASEIELY
jgi:hypothetical protein